MCWKTETLNTNVSYKKLFESASLTQVLPEIKEEEVFITCIAAHHQIDPDALTSLWAALISSSFIYIMMHKKYKKKLYFLKVECVKLSFI